MKTYTLKAGEIDKAWHVLDAENVPLGRLASRAAVLLRGKHKPTFTPHLDMGDFVVVVNAGKVRLSSSEDDKKYYRHSGYPGGLRTRTFREMRQKHPARIVELAVKGMLPHNRLGAKVLRHLKVYAGAAHPHQAQVSAGSGARAQRRRDMAPAVAAPPRPARQTTPKTEPVAAAPTVEETTTAAPAVEEAPPVAAKPKAVAKPKAAAKKPKAAEKKPATSRSRKKTGEGSDS